MKPQTYRTDAVTVQQHKSKEGPRITWVVHQAMTARVFLGEAGVINFLNGRITEQELQSVEHWLNSLDSGDDFTQLGDAQAA